MVLRFLQHEEGEGRGRRVPGVDLLRGFEGRRKVTGEEAGLELSDPVVAFEECEGGLAGGVGLEGALAVRTVVERAELRGLAAQRPDEGERRRHPVEEEAEGEDEGAALLGLVLDPVERMAHGEESGDEAAAGVGGEGWLAVALGQLEGAAGRVDRFRERPGPGDYDGEAVVGAAAEVVQAAALDQVAGHPGEAIAAVVVAEARAGDHARGGVAHRRGGAVAVLEAEVGGAADAEGDEVVVDVLGRDAHLGEELEDRQGFRVPHQRQVDDVLDRSVAEQGPDALVLAAGCLVARVRRPVDARAPQAVERDRHGALADAEHGVEVHAPAGDSAVLDGAGGAAGEGEQALLGGVERAGADFAVGGVQLDLEGLVVAVLPSGFG